MKIKIRKYIPGRDNDTSIVMSSWLRGFHDSYCTGPIRDNKYWEVYKTEIEAILNNPDTEVLVACNPELEWQVFGYAVFESGHSYPVLHWIFTKPVYRRKRVANQLLSPRISGKYYYTFAVKQSVKLVNESKTFSGGEYNPLVVKKERKQ